MLKFDKLVLSKPNISDGEGICSPRVTRLKLKLSESMLKQQTRWKPGSVLDNDQNKILPLQIRRSLAVARVLNEMPIEIAEDELIVGKCAKDGVIIQTSLPEFASENEKEKAQEEGFGIPGGLSHKTPDYPTLLNMGLRGILQNIDKKTADIILQPDSTKKNETLLFFETVRIECEAVIKMAHRYAELANHLADSTSPARKVELRKISEICQRVPEFPAQTFQEALQSVWFVHYALFSSNTCLSLGRMDQYSSTYLERDIQAEHLTQEDAQELVDCLWIKFNDRAQILRQNFAPQAKDHPWQVGYRWRTLIASDSADAINHWGQNILLSGIKPDGEDGTNLLTDLMLNSMERFEYTSPVVTVRLHQKSPTHLVRRVAQVLKKGGGMPYIDNDDVLIPAYQKLGVPVEDARDYSNSNCWETMIAGKSDQELIRGFNFLLILEWVFNRGISLSRNAQEGLDTGDPYRFTSFTEIINAWKQQLDTYVCKTIEIIGSGYEGSNLYHSNHGRYAFNPLLSALTQDCIKREKDVIRGGAQYVIWHCMAEAVANCIDALAAIKKLVYDEKKVTLGTLLDALKANWSGYENLRQLVIAQAPKYANNQPYADEIGIELLSFFCERTRFHSQRFPSIIFPCAVGTFSWYASIGREVGASCDGRYSGDPISPNFSPNLGMDLSGPTSSVRSYCRMPGTDLAGGAPLDLRLSAAHLRYEEGTDRLTAFIRTFILLGGNMITLTVTDVEELKRAILDPMHYRGLRVRMGGWTAYFIALSPDQQRLHLARIEHGF